MRMRFVPAVAVVVTALALYATRGVLDQVVTPAGPVRVALLPPWQAFAGFVAIGLLGLLWLDRRAVPRGTSTAVRPPLGPMVLPLLGLGLLLIPFLPFIPDGMPELQMLAGPMRAIVWLAIAAQLAWVLWQARLLRADWLQQRTVAQLTVAVACATALISGAAAMRLTGTPLFPAGDEPHYLVIAQSLWRDGDLKIENNHRRNDYREYFNRELAPHYLTRGADREIYSIHPVGMPVLIAPVYAAGGYPAVVLAFVLIAALAAAAMWWWVLRASNSPGATTFALAAVVCTTPFLFNSFAVYPEMPAALATVVALLIATTYGGSTRLTPWLIVGTCCAALPWFSTKYAPMSAAMIVIALARIVFPNGFTRSLFADGKPAAAAALLVPYAVSLAGWFYFFYAIWGVPLPQAPYGTQADTRPLNLLFGAPGLLFDQEYGLLPYAPVYILAATGLWAMVREGGEARRRAIEIGLAFAPLLATVGAYRIWWGGSASPGRPVASGLLLLALPMAMAFRSTAAGSARRAAHHLLLWLSIGIALVLGLAQEGLLTANGRDGTSSLLEFLSPRWPAWTMVPSFIHHEAGTAWMHSLAWLAIAALAAFALMRVRAAHAGTASLAAVGTCAAALLVAAIVIPLLPADPPWPGIEMRARPRLPLLDDFDAVAKPLAIEYAPVRIISAREAVTHAMLSVEPYARLEAQPIRVLHNGRFSLPAGHYRVDVEWSGARSSDTIALQIGRTGNAWRTWPVEARPGEHWTTEFAMPVDASFVGLRGSAELERVIRRITIVPLSVIDVGQRPRVGAVLAASDYEQAAVFYYDTYTTPEGAGFWVWGERTARVSIERKSTGKPLILKVHSGLITNQLSIATFGWNRTITLQPLLPDTIEIDAARDRRFVTLEFTAANAFVPAELDPQSDDTRRLGVWVEVVQ